MNLVLMNSHDIKGGAARAAYRIHHALRGYGVDSSMLVSEASAGDWTVESSKSQFAKTLREVRALIARLPIKRLKTGNPNFYSPAIVPSRWSNHLNVSDADVIHLHWVNGEMMSIADIGNITKPVVWTLHDMWAFCGAEHYTEDHRWRDGYMSGNRPSHESGFDLNRWTWARKFKHWKRPRHIVTPSRWLGECARQSQLMRDWPITVVPNPIDTEVWRPMDKALARQLLALPPDVPLLLFGAVGGGQDPRKGFDLLQAALNHLRGQLPGMELVVLGQLAPKVSVDMGFPVHYVGHLHDNLSLRLLYSAADAIVVPSRQDNLPQSATEAQACGCPVVAFDVTGLPDAVVHGETGYLAEAFSSDDLARGIEWIFADADRYVGLSNQARARAVRLWSPEVVVPQYMNVYQSCISSM
jgi:glycosyltransferase involved in cell wall biosynthesis